MAAQAQVAIKWFVTCQLCDKGDVMHISSLQPVFLSDSVWEKSDITKPFENVPSTLTRLLPNQII